VLFAGIAFDLLVLIGGRKRFDGFGQDINGDDSDFRGLSTSQNPLGFPHCVASRPKSFAVTTPSASCQRFENVGAH